MSFHIANMSMASLKEAFLLFYGKFRNGIQLIDRIYMSNQGWVSGHRYKMIAGETALDFVKRWKIKLADFKDTCTRLANDEFYTIEGYRAKLREMINHYNVALRALELADVRLYPITKIIY